MTLDCQCKGCKERDGWLAQCLKTGITQLQTQQRFVSNSSGWMVALFPQPRARAGSHWSFQRSYFRLHYRGCPPPPPATPPIGRGLAENVSLMCINTKSWAAARTRQPPPEILLPNSIFSSAHSPSSRLLFRPVQTFVPYFNIFLVAIVDTNVCSICF